MPACVESWVSPPLPLRRGPHLRTPPGTFGLHADDPRGESRSPWVLGARVGSAPSPQGGAPRLAKKETKQNKRHPRKRKQNKANGTHTHGARRSPKKHPPEQCGPAPPPKAKMANGGTGEGAQGLRQCPMPRMGLEWGDARYPGADDISYVMRAFGPRPGARGATPGPPTRPREVKALVAGAAQETRTAPRVGMVAARSSSNHVHRGL